MIEYEQLSRSERMARIGELLAKGISLLVLAEQQDGAALMSSVGGASHSGVKNGKESQSGPPELLEDEERRIMAYVCKMHSASPRELQQHFGLSKATAYRRLSRLVEANLLVRTGATKGVVYRLNGTKQRTGITAGVDEKDRTTGI
jgi:uncharacterized membrane protein